MTDIRRLTPMLAGALVAILFGLLLQHNGRTGGYNSNSPLSTNLNALAMDIQKDGPLLDGQKITLQEAKAADEFQLPVPPTNFETDERTGIWVDDSGQIAFVWSSDLRYYINRLDGESSKEEMVTSWERKAQASGEGQKQPAELVTVRGETAIGHELVEGSVSNLSFTEKGLVLQFVSPAHTLDELREFAAAIKYE